MKDEQAVAEDTEVETESSAEENGAQDDLDELLSKYDTENTSTDPEPKDDEPVTRADLEAVRSTIEQRETKEALASLATALRGDLDNDVHDDDRVIGYAERRAQNDPRIMRAWQQRYQDPKSWEKVAAGLARQYQKPFRDQPDRQATEDREAVVAAARSASTRASESDFPSDREIAGMSDAEFFNLSTKLRMKR